VVSNARTIIGHLVVGREKSRQLRTGASEDRSMVAPGCDE
jgi:hypothetical protein